MSKRAAVLAACLLLFAASASAQDRGDVLEKFSLSLGSFLSSSKTTLTVNGGIPGTKIGFEKQLGLDDSKNLARAHFDWRFARKHSVGLGWYSLDRSRSDRINTEIVFDDVVFPIDTVVQSSLGLEFIDVSYTYWPYRTDRQALGVTGGLVEVALTAGLRNIPADGDPDFNLEGRASTDLPVPGIGVAYKALFGESFMFNSRIGAVPTLSIGDYKGDTLNAIAAVEYLFLDHYAVGVAYSFLGFRVELDKPLFRGSISYKIRGGQAYLRFRW